MKPSSPRCPALLQGLLRGLSPVQRCGLLCGLLVAAVVGIVPVRAVSSEAAHEPVAQVAAVAAESGPSLDPARVTWTALHYEVGTWLGSARSQVSFEAAPSALEQLRQPGVDSSAKGTPVTASPGDLWLLRLDSSYWGRSESERVWLDTASGATLQRMGSKADQDKTFRFTDAGVWAVRTKKPSGAENDWFVDYPSGLPQCAVVSEPGILFYLLAVAPPAEGETLQHCVYAKKGLHLLEIEHVGQVKVEVEFDERLADGRQRRREGDVTAVRYAVRTKFLATTRDDEKGAALRLLGLEGDLEIDVEPRLRLPLQVCGDLPRVGNVTVRLTRAELRPISG